MAFLGWLFIGKLFAPYLPADQITSYIAGLIILAAAPCTAMVFVWSNLSDGEPHFTLSQVAVNDVIMIFAFAPIVAFLLPVLATGCGGESAPSRDLPEGLTPREQVDALAAQIVDLHPHLAHLGQREADLGHRIEWIGMGRQVGRACVRRQVRFDVSQTVSDIIYDGLWFSAFHQDLMGFVEKNQRFVTGLVRVRLFKGSCVVTGLQSPHSLYSEELYQPLAQLAF